MVQNDFFGIIGEDREWYPLWRQNSVPRSRIEIQKTPPQEHRALTSAFEPILVVTILGVAEMFKSVINEMTFATDFKLINLLHAENANLAHQDLKTSLDKPENRSHIHLALATTLGSVRDTRVFRSALTALMEPRTL